VAVDRISDSLEDLLCRAAAGLRFNW